MDNRKLTYTADLGWCMARGVTSEGDVPSVTIVSAANDDGGSHTPAESVCVYGRKGVEALGKICRHLCPEAPLNGLQLRETGGLYPDHSKEFELDFRAPDGTHVTIPLPAGPAKDVILAWWKSQAPK